MSVFEGMQPTRAQVVPYGPSLMSTKLLVPSPNLVQRGQTCGSGSDDGDVVVFRHVHLLCLAKTSVSCPQMIRGMVIGREEALIALMNLFHILTMA